MRWFTYGEDHSLQLHVGWEAWRRFIPEPDLIELMR